MKNIINSSEIQRKGLKGIYETIDQYGQAFIVNQRSPKVLKIIDGDNPKLLTNIIKSIKKIKAILKKEYGIDQVGIFGSYARGENRPDSDLDLIIDYKIEDLDIFYKIEDLIKESLKVNNIDLLTLDGISPFAYESLKNDVIYV